MTNAGAINGFSSGSNRNILGNFGVSVDHPWVYQQLNGNLNATFGNTDFIGPGVVVDEPGATSFSNYEMKTRIGVTNDDDAVGVIVRAQDDNNFYRITFVSSSQAISTTRPPRGMSVQKVQNGVWTELYRETGTPLFLYPHGNAGENPATPGYPLWDLKVGAVGDTLKIQVKDQNGNVINYPLITDSSNPILTGSVGFQTWGNQDSYFMGYGGLDTPLLKTLTSLKDVDLIIDRSTGNISLVNNDPTLVNIKGVTIQSPAGALNSAQWLSIANNYDRPSPPTPGNGSVDSDDAWTITSSTALNLSEAEQTGNGGTIAAAGTVNFGNAWTKSRLEDVVADLTLADGSSVSMDVLFINGPNGGAYRRSDLNTDGVVNTADWSLFYPNLLANLSSFTGVQRALKGDLDGDGDNDVNDFALFKADFNLANGAGAFEAMLGVPEPTSLFLLTFAAGLMLVRRRSRRTATACVLAICGTALLSGAEKASAVAVDFTTYTVENFPKANGQFPTAVWTTTKLTAQPNNDADTSVLYSPASALGKRYLGLLKPGVDDDVIGFALGIKPGDGQIGSTADYLLIDWKAATQTFDFVDGNAINFFHDQTAGGSMPIGLALSRVTGSPTDDELWQHTDDPNNPSGGVTQLVRAATKGSTAYNRANGTHLFDIRYSATNVNILVDGVEQFNQNGAFPDGRFGLYSAYQNPGPVFSNFEEVPLSGFDGLSVTVDRQTGNITLQNSGTVAVDFDYYELDSASNSLKPATWTSLSDQNFQSIGGGSGQHWQEAGGSSTSALGEAYLQSNSTLAGGASVSLGTAYNTAVAGEDIALKFRLASGLVLSGTVTYSGSVGVPGDYNSNGVVDAADYVLWRKNVGGTTLSNRGTGITGPVGTADYDFWRSRFGSTSGSGSSIAGGQNVPEPPVSGILIVAAMVLGFRGTARTSTVYTY
jgi:hypothetical protein